MTEPGSTAPGPQETAPPRPLPATALPITFWGLVLLVLAAVGLVFVGGGLILVAGALLSGSDGGLLDSAWKLAGSWQFVLAVTAWQFVAMMLAIRYVGMRRAGLDWRGMGLRPVGPRWWLGGIALALLAIPLASLTTRLTQVLLDLPLDMPQLEALAPEGFQPLAAVGMTLLGALAIPLAEELLFRGFLHGWLRRHLAFWPAALTGSALFGLVHGQIAIIPGTFLIGMVLVWARERSGSLTAPWIIHAAFNGVQLIILYWALAAGVDLEEIPL